MYDPLGSFAFFRIDGAGAYGSRSNVTLQQCMVACQQAPDCERYARLGAAPPARAAAGRLALKTAHTEELHGVLCSTAAPHARSPLPSTQLCDQRGAAAVLPQEGPGGVGVHSAGQPDSLAGVSQPWAPAPPGADHAAPPSPSPPQCPEYDSCWAPEVLCNSTDDRGGSFSFPCGHWASYYRLDMNLDAACRWG